MLVGPGVQVQILELLQPLYHQVGNTVWDEADIVKGRMKERKEQNQIPNNSVKLLDQPNLCLEFLTV